MTQLSFEDVSGQTLQGGSTIGGALYATEQTARLTRRRLKERKQQTRCGLRCTSVHGRKAKGEKMLETLAIILVALWLLGLATSYTLGGVIHILLVIAVVVVLIRVIQGRRL